MSEQLAAHYGLALRSLERLDAGADPLAEVFRAVATDGSVYFVKATRRTIPEYVLRVPHLLAQRGVPGIVAPLATRDGSLWAEAQGCQLILYPFLESATAYARPLTDAQWEMLGRTLAQIHSADVPFDLPCETYPTDNQMFVEVLLSKPLPAPLEPFRTPMTILLTRAQELGKALRTQNPMPFVLTHGDLHAWNVVVDDAGQLFIVDWDEALLAPRERDLMFIGGGVGNAPWTMEQPAFWRGYGVVEPDPLALTYYRCDRILADIVAIEDAEEMASQFAPGNVVEIADTTYRRFFGRAR